MDELVLAFGRGELQETALYLLLLWLASTVAARWLSERKGYGEKPGPGRRPVPVGDRRADPG